MTSLLYHLRFTKGPVEFEQYLNWALYLDPEKPKPSKDEVLEIRTKMIRDKKMGYEMCIKECTNYINS
jgi:hypothetical protein